MRLTRDPTTPTVILRDAASGRWLLFERPLEILETRDLSQILPLLRAAETAAASRGLYAAGVIAYEAAPAFDPALAVRPTDSKLPLLWLGLFHSPRTITLEPPPAVAPDIWQPSVTPDAYRAAFDRIKRHIREGDAYQVNLTYRLRATLAGGQPEVSGQRSEVGDRMPEAGGQRAAPDHQPPPVSSYPFPVSCSLNPEPRHPLPSLPLFTRLVTAQNATYGACVSTALWTLYSASPELFFSLNGTHLESRPMKGTAPRGLTLEQDRANAAALQLSEKNRAENLMIVDMVRNDLGRVAKPGSVTVPSLFSLEKYPNVWQLTSTVQAETHASVADIFAALFPAASITGAPKSSAMRIIAETEADPRRFYTGAVGFLAPDRRAQFNVAIRTLLVEHASGLAEYGTGGGIVWDSECAIEQGECRTKALILNASAEPFSLLETMLWMPGEGFNLLDYHLTRLSDSAEYFDVPVDPAALRKRLTALAGSLPPAPHRVRLLAARDGAITLAAAPFAPARADKPLRVALAPSPVDRSDPFLYHKTTRRRLYEEALAARPGFDDVILFNGDGEVTESTRANIVAEIEGRRVTPPVCCGLLPGTLRQHLLDAGEVTTRIITVDELMRSPRFFLVNSLRGQLPAQFSS